jgi:hypothetical protein
MFAEFLLAATIGCSMQSGADFPGAFQDPRNLVAGPFAWLGARAGYVDGEYGDVYRWKQPVLLRPGHTVRLTVGAVARLTYDFDGWSFARGERTVVFRACSARRAMSHSDGRPVTFWSGGIVMKRQNACVPVEIRIDHRPVRRRVVAYGNADC